MNFTGTDAVETMDEETRCYCYSHFQTDLTGMLVYLSVIVDLGLGPRGDRGGLMQFSLKTIFC